jgi:DNA-3-methyladenine glycosylase
MSLARAPASTPDTDVDGLSPVARRTLARPSPEVAPDLLGLLVVRETADGVTVGRIVEVEAYHGPSDLASHARAGRTRRTATMFGPPGHAYVYLIYGLHSCLNIVTELDGEAGAVLVRALEPMAGIELMRRRRGDPRDPDSRLAAGPARLCQAMAIDRALDGHDLTGRGELWLADPRPRAIAAQEIAVGRRIGVDYAGDGWADRPWRFGIRGHPSLSRPFRETGP